MSLAIMTPMFSAWGVRAAALAALLVAASAPAAAGQAPAASGAPTREELLDQVRRLEEEMRDLRTRLEEARRAIPGQAEAVVTVPAGARQGTPFVSEPGFGPSDWIPTWAPAINPSPQARQLTPAERGVVPPPPEGPLDFPRYIPGRVVVRHGLGPSPVTVDVALLNADGSVSLQVNPNRIVVRASNPPDGTFTILNYTEESVTLRWVAQRPAP